MRPAAAAAQQQQQQRPPRPPRCCWLIMRLFSSREDDLGSIFDFLVLYIISTVVRIKLPRRTVRDVRGAHASEKTARPLGGGSTMPGVAAVIDTKVEPPAWAKLQRELLEKQTEACVEFFGAFDNANLTARSVPRSPMLGASLRCSPLCVPQPQPLCPGRRCSGSLSAALLAPVRAATPTAEHYFNVETGYGNWIPRWGGNDGPDDAAENGLNWTVLYALGAPPVILELWKRGYEGHLKQYTEAKTVEVPMAREGMYYRDFSVMFDFFHHTESLSAFTLSGLADPFDAKYAERTKRFAAMYMGDDPEAPNYDKERKLIRSIFTGSRGPMLRKATGLDWAGDPLTYADGTPTDIEEMVREGRGGLALLHGEHSYQQMIEHFEEYNDVAGDSPLNLCATSQTFNAFCLTQVRAKTVFPYTFSLPLERGNSTIYQDRIARDKHDEQHHS